MSSEYHKLRQISQGIRKQFELVARNIQFLQQFQLLDITAMEQELLMVIAVV